MATPATATQQSFGFDVTHGFLGEEFLTWLWFRWETQVGEFTLPGGRVVGVVIDDMLNSAEVDWIRDPDPVNQPQEGTEADDS